MHPWRSVSRTSPRPSLARLRALHTRDVVDHDIARLSSKSLSPLTLRDLVKHGTPPLSTQQLLDSANFTLSILPSRLAHRIQSLRSLPYIVVANPHVSAIHDKYLHSLSTLLPYAEQQIQTTEQETHFTHVLTDLVQTHNNTISVLARGFLEARKYISPAAVTDFLDQHLRARIGTRLIAEQHIALHLASQPNAVKQGSYNGAIDTCLKPADVLRSCEVMVGDISELTFGLRPSVTIDGEMDTSLAHVPMHVEYILTELLKNSFRAVMEAKNERIPVRVTIAPAERTGGATASGVTIRIRDRGGGISPANLAKLWEYGFTTFDEQQISAVGVDQGLDTLTASAGAPAGTNTLAGLGYGLPLGRAYAEYFGGSIAVQSLWGWGTDVYLSLKGVGDL